MKKDLTFRVTVESDAQYLNKWIMEPGVLRWFPMCNLREVEDASRVWVSYGKIGASITAEIEGKPYGMANLYIHSLKKLRHQCLFAIIVGEEYRGNGIGTQLLDYITKLAKEKFHIELFHLEVYEGNPAISLYKRENFIEYGRHENFLREPDRYRTKIFMQKKLS